MEIDLTWNNICQNSRNSKPIPQNWINTVQQATKKPIFEPISFGTSGWRAIIGKEFNFYSVQKVTAAIVKTYQSETIDLEPFEEFQKKGVVIGHDNRLFAQEFAQNVIAVLQKHNIHYLYAGECSTPELSSSVRQRGCAGAINLTPSHNPPPYGGYKYNINDGGPAPLEFTQAVEKHYQSISFEFIEKSENIVLDSIPVIDDYENFIQKQGMVNLSTCQKFAHTQSITLAINPFFGSTKNKIAQLLNYPNQLKQFYNEPDPFFQGKEPEPSLENMQSMIDFLNQQNTPFKLGAIMDPDGDRVRFYDGEQVINMNEFGAIATHYYFKQHHKKQGVARSVATSHFVDKIAQSFKAPIYETAIGFKNFRSYLQKNQATICFEESDGMSAMNHLYEKDALFATLLALEIIQTTHLSLGQYLKNLQQQFGHYYPIRKGFAIDKQQIAKIPQMINTLLQKYPQGSTLIVNNKPQLIQKVVTLDGVKWVFEDNSWVMIRPSGTEPKIRVYAESSNAHQSQQLFKSIQTIATNLL